MKTYRVTRFGGAHGELVCDCYVADLPKQTQMELHYGAHNPDCPVYRVSQDPVDFENDEYFRSTHEREPDESRLQGHEFGL